MMNRTFPTWLISLARGAAVSMALLAMVLQMGAAPKNALQIAPVEIAQASVPPIQSESPTELLRDLPEQPKPLLRQVQMEVTAYCACTKCCGPNAIGLTASGKHVSYNDGKFVAADPSVPFGARLIIPGYSDHPVEVLDRGSAIRGNKLDVFFPSHEQALEWGRRMVTVTLLQNDSPESVAAR